MDKRKKLIIGASNANSLANELLVPCVRIYKVLPYLITNFLARKEHILRGVEEIYIFPDCNSLYPTQKSFTDRSGRFHTHFTKHMKKPKSLTTYYSEYSRLLDHLPTHCSITIMPVFLRNVFPSCSCESAVRFNTGRAVFLARTVERGLLNLAASKGFAKIDLLEQSTLCRDILSSISGEEFLNNTAQIEKVYTFLLLGTDGIHFSITARKVVIEWFKHYLNLRL